MLTEQRIIDAQVAIDVFEQTANRSNFLKIAIPDRRIDRGRTISVPENTGLLEQTDILTPSGRIAIGSLSRGDDVILQDGQLARIQHVLLAPNSSHCVEIRAPYLGLDQDLLVGREQMIAISCLTAEYLFGTPSVLVPAWVFCNTVRARNVEKSQSTRFLQLQLDRPGAVCIGKCEVAALSTLEDSHQRALTRTEAQAFAMEYNQGAFF